MNYDVILIGAGHNALVCAAYLLKAGYSVLLLEKNAVPGGGATTLEVMPEAAPGFFFNPCAIDHVFIHLGPVVQELELHKYGLEYLYCDPLIFSPHPDGKYFYAHKSVEQTCQEIARFSPRDAEKYRQYDDFWQRMISALVPVFNAPPKSIIDIALNYNLTQIKDLLSLIGGDKKTLDLVRTLFTSAQDLLEEYFDAEFLRAPLARLSSELSVPPSQKTSAIGALMMSMRHNPGVARPKGGSGALTEALLKLVTHLGGQVLTEQPVEKILVDDGRAVGVRVAGGREYRASKAVISSLDAKRVFLELLSPAEVDGADPELRDRMQRRVTSHNNAILKIDCALSELPRFEHHQHRDEYWTGAVLIADSVDHVELAHTDPNIGRIPDGDPSMYAVIPSFLDPSLAPPGLHTLWIEFFAPYAIKGAEGTGLKGTGWTEETKEKVADRVIDKLASYAPNLKQAIIARRVESPAEIGQRLGVEKGNYYHFDMTFDMMMPFRPLPELANYETPIKNLLLTGAGTHPGGSISGIPGRNCAHVFLQQQNPLSALTQRLTSLVK
ncbi:beta-carotene ketolase CrtO [Pseudanabaena sp. FACHB-2040]|uniref:beta-carotene ketolase CrtO n=1 Tax=Pseudanabaena sp. FACHB-2040 TaxID=2692859 RepID=UPI001685C815|nr:NAD(P)/FAD-dependent oxidoreductase [Pseudanabaena sp. FACHB-2040]MBD2256503.1 NAD(P)/FAD-dependent oxidoreductase [Pseudanabaena sp. FACHB-2040]